MPLVVAKQDGAKLIDEFRRVFRLKHYSTETERTYWYYVVQFFRFTRRPPRDCGMEEIRAYLSHLAADCGVASGTQNLALCALRFLYTQVYRVELPFITGIEWAKRSRRIPVVFTRSEAERVVALLPGIHRLIGGLM